MISVQLPAVRSASDPLRRLADVASSITDQIRDILSEHARMPVDPATL